ncbi:MAG: YraN family protein [Clostridiales bacterium]|nr:YraN family protein [Clostridiales bacterium]
MNTKISGAMGEAYVAEYFRKKRYKLLAMNYRSHMGEIDLIAAKGNKLRFIEVKLRRSGGVTRPADAVSRAKQSRLRATAEIWLAQNPGYAGCDMAFTVAELYMDEAGKIMKMELIEEAF